MIRLITDTTSTINIEEAKNIGISLLPQIIIFGDKEFRDDYEISSEEFLKKLRSSSTLPHTAAPSPALYTPIYGKIISDGDSALVLCPSAKVSGTFRSATVAAQDFPQAEITIIDTQIIGPAFGYIVRETLLKIQQGLSISEILKWISKKSQSLVIYFYVDTLEYLQKGGRIGLAKALVGSVLQIKPILLFKDGQVNPFENQRTKKRALARIIELVKRDCPQTPECNLSIFQADAIDDAEALRKEFKEFSRVSEISITHLPPAIVVHAGPGVVAVSFFTH
jgi:DegV family protein with EDD domain